jgi:hypothetical protein
MKLCHGSNQRHKTHTLQSAWAALWLTDAAHAMVDIFIQLSVRG